MSITKAPSPWLLWVALTTPLLLSILYVCVQDCNHPLTMPRLFILKVRCFHKSVGDLWRSPYWLVWASGGCFWCLCSWPGGNYPYDQGQRESNSRIQVAELEFSFNFLGCLSWLGYQHLVYPQAGVELLSKEGSLPVPRSGQRETSFQVYTTSHLFCGSFYPESSQEQEVIFQGLLWRQGVRKHLEQRFEAAIPLFIIQCL